MFFLLISDLCAQVLGEKPELPEVHHDDTKMDASNRKMAKLYKVRRLFLTRTTL